MPVCDNSDRVKSLLVDVCKGMRGCEGRVERIKGSKDWKPGYKITESGAVKSNSCAVLTVQCKGVCSVCVWLIVQHCEMLT